MKLAAASCTKLQQINPQPVWDKIRSEKPDVLLLHGDNVYLEHDHHDDPAQLGDELARLYAAQFAEPAFNALLTDVRGRGGRVVAIYDDHDFLGNNRYGGDHGPALREAARQAFVAAFDPPRTRDDVYHVLKLGDVDLVVLDQRYYRQSPQVSATSRSAILGEAQWKWFEDAVSSSTARYLAIVSTTTVHTFGDESWEQYPASFRRLQTLLQGRRGAFVISGDVHRNATYDDSGIVEIVTSGVARNGIVFGGPRQNYGIFIFEPTQLHVQLQCLKVNGRFDFTIPLVNWTLP